MQLCAVVERSDVIALIEQATPLRIEISRRPRRMVSLGRPTRLDFVPGAGLRLRGDARFQWDIAGLTVPVTLRAYQVLLVPSIAVRGNSRVLAFDPVLEDLDFKAVPFFFDERIAEAINEGLASQKHKLAWGFEQALGLSRALPQRVQPGGRFDLVPADARVSVTANAMRLEVDFAARVTRDADPLGVADAFPPSSRRSGPTAPAQPMNR